MRVFHIDSAVEELQKLPKDVKEKFWDIKEALARQERMPKSKFKKLSGYQLFEFRVKHGGNIFRGLIGKMKNDFVILSYFRKKSMKIPSNEIRKAISRLKSII